MDPSAVLHIIKVLSNETRLNILRWLKTPEAHFGVQNHNFEGGICVGSIQDKCGLAQSVVSGYLAMMQKAGLLESQRIGQWTYYRRNEATIQAFVDELQREL
jgi:ArsR family transcriptional regulator